MTSTPLPSPGFLAKTVMGALPTVPVTSLLLSTGLMTVYLCSLSAYRSSQLLTRS